MGKRGLDSVPAHGVHIRVPVEPEAVLAYVVHEEEGLEVECAVAEVVWGLAGEAEDGPLGRHQRSRLQQQQQGAHHHKSHHSPPIYSWS